MCVKLSFFELSEDIPPHKLSLLTQAELATAQMFRHPKIKQHYLAVRIQLREVLADYLQVSAEKIVIAKTKYGKPYLLDYPELDFNISHTGAYLLIGISSAGRIGVDIEQPKAKINLTELVKKCFAPEEISYWQTLSVTKQTATFYRFWTRKEAFVKAVGRGIALGLSRCVIADSTPPYFSQIPTEYGLASDWRLFDLALAETVYAAVVLEKAR